MGLNRSVNRYVTGLLTGILTGLYPVCNRSVNRSVTFFFYMEYFSLFSTGCRFVNSDHE